jgi:hypothetical protein
MTCPGWSGWGAPVSEQVKRPLAADYAHIGDRVVGGPERTRRGAGGGPAGEAGTAMNSGGLEGFGLHQGGQDGGQEASLPPSVSCCEPTIDTRAASWDRSGTILPFLSRCNDRLHMVPRGLHDDTHLGGRHHQPRFSLCLGARPDGGLEKVLSCLASCFMLCSALADSRARGAVMSRPCTRC